MPLRFKGIFSTIQFDKIFKPHYELFSRQKSKKMVQKNRENFLIFSFRWTILPSDVSMPGGELGPTLKLKRFFFNKKYNDSIERLYV